MSCMIIIIAYGLSHVLKWCKNKSVCVGWGGHVDGGLGSVEMRMGMGGGRAVCVYMFIYICVCVFGRGWGMVMGGDGCCGNG